MVRHTKISQRRSFVNNFKQIMLHEDRRRDTAGQRGQRLKITVSVVRFRPWAPSPSRFTVRFDAKSTLWQT